MRNFLVLGYTYRDADNYKVSLQVAVPGELSDQDVNRLLVRLADGEGFVPGQIGLPDLQMNFNGGITYWDEERDHPFHEIDDITVVERAPNGSMMLNSLTAADLLDKALGVIQWDEDYRPDFHGAMAELKKEFDRDPDAFMKKVIEQIERTSPPAMDF
jgi:hypothetical protein